MILYTTIADGHATGRRVKFRTAKQAGRTRAFYAVTEALQNPEPVKQWLFKLPYA